MWGSFEFGIFVLWTLHVLKSANQFIIIRIIINRSFWLIKSLIFGLFCRIYSPYQTHASTLGRFSASTNQLRSPTYTTSSQTLPRKLEHRPAHSSTINVSIVNTVAPPTQNTGPAKPARSYKALNRSKSLNVHGISETNGTAFKSNPQLNLKSPSIVSMISRSQRDLRPVGATPVREVDTQKSLFLRGLQEQAPELYRTLHGEDELSPMRTNYSRFSVERAPRNGDLRTRSPVTINKDTASIIRRGSSSTDDYSETYNYTTRNDDPRRPSITNTTQNFSKKTIPGKGVVESSKTKSVTTSRYVPDLHNSHLLNRHVIEVRGNSPRHWLALAWSGKGIFPYRSVSKSWAQFLII